MKKSKVIKAIHAALKTQFDRIVHAATESADYANDAESKSDGKYDTRGLEASYLAAGQAAKAEEMAADLRYFTSPVLKEFSESDSIDHGALVLTGQGFGFLLAGRSGGTSVTIDGEEITVLTPTSPLYQNLEGLRVGDSLEQPPITVAAIY